MTMREKVEYTHVDDTIRSLKKQIDQDNKEKVALSLFRNQ